MLTTKGTTLDIRETREKRKCNLPRSKKMSKKKKGPATGTKAKDMLLLHEKIANSRAISTGSSLPV